MVDSCEKEEEGVAQFDAVLPSSLLPWMSVLFFASLLFLQLQSSFSSSLLLTTQVVTFALMITVVAARSFLVPSRAKVFDGGKR